jgi:hypothetical protein
MSMSRNLELAGEQAEYAFSGEARLWLRRNQKGCKSPVPHHREHLLQDQADCK